MEFITNQDAFDDFVRTLKGTSVLAIDTEFLREKTYYPRLCLLQLATDNAIAVVDPFKVEKLGVLAEALQDESIVKVLHAGSQDIEILLRETGVVPHPLFDTQIAATLMGHVQQVGLGPLVSSVLGVQLKKGDSFTDWSRRPLSRSQMNYAADDVRYLPKVYNRMHEELEKLDRLHWLDEEFEELSNPNRYQLDPRERFRKLKRVSSLNRRQLSAAREAAAWREKKAQQHDIPRKWIVTDEQIVEACKREARSIDELYMVRGLAEKLSTKAARELVNAISTGLNTPKDRMPKIDKPSRNEVNVDVEIDVMSAIVRLRARENNIALQTLASHGDLSEVARGYDAPVLHGWRREIVGDELQEFLQGKLTISCSDGTVKVTKR